MLRTASRRVSLQALCAIVSAASMLALDGCAPRKRTAIVIAVGSDIPAGSITRIELTIRGITATGTMMDITTQQDVFHYGTGMTRTFPGNLVVYQEQNFVGIEVSIVAVPTMGAGLMFTNRARANFVTSDWRQLDMYLPLQCTTAEVQQRCAAMSVAGMEFVCGSVDVNNPCVSTSRSTLPPFNNPVVDASTPMDGALTDATVVGPDSPFPATLPPGFPWAGAVMGSQQVPFRWTLLPGATRARLILCSDIECTTTLDVIEATDRATIKIQPGRYAYKITQSDDQGTNVGPAPIPHPFEVAGYGHTFANAIGTAMFLNPTDLDRDFVFGAKIRDVAGPRVHVGGVADTVASDNAALVGAPAFGRALANAGDFNGDGYSDILIAAQSATDSSARDTHLALRVPATTPRMTRTFAWTQVPFRPSGVSMFSPAWAVAGGGDINGDGFADVVVGIPSISAGMGRVQVLSGHAAPSPATMAQQASSSAPLMGSTPYFGSAVVSGCDFDGDGYADFAVGSTTIDGSPQPSPLGVKVFFGGAGGAYPFVVVDPPAGPGVSMRFGAVLACGADINGDGFSELAIGDPDSLNASRALVGSVGLWSFARRIPTPVGLIEGPGMSHYGSALTMGAIPFVEAAGLQVVQVLVVGAPDGGPAGAGEVTVVRRNTQGNMERLLRFNSFLPNARGGTSLAIAEVNGYATVGNPNPRDTTILMGVPGPCVDNAGAPSMELGCIYAMVPRGLSMGDTAVVNKLQAWEPVTGNGVGISLAH